MAPPPEEEEKSTLIFISSLGPVNNISASHKFLQIEYVKFGRVSACVHQASRDNGAPVNEATETYQSK